MKLSSFFQWSLLVGMLALPVVLVALPVSFFDHGPKLCLSQLILHRACYGCGMTRACMRLIHGQMEEAGDFNRLAYVVFPILCLLYGAEVLKLAMRLGVPVPGRVVGVVRRLGL